MRTYIKLQEYLQHILSASLSAIGFSQPHPKIIKQMNTYLIEISKDKRDCYWFFNKGLVDDFSHTLAPGKFFDDFHSYWARRYV